MCLMSYANNKGADQPAQKYTLKRCEITLFCKKVLKYVATMQWYVELRGIWYGMALGLGNNMWYSMALRAV